jgi:menaquinone-dependent protoporphyrinogen oxidase
VLPDALVLELTKEATMTILVAYATRHGSTEEVAAAVAAHLRESGLEAKLVPAVDVETLDGYDGVVLGGALYMGRLHHDARRLLKRFHRGLATMPFAAFAMGPLTMKAQDVAGSRKQLGAALAKVPDVEPFAVAIFGGVIHQDEHHFPFNQMPESDARDWEAIRAWSAELAQVFAERKPVSAESTRSGSVARL